MLVFCHYILVICFTANELLDFKSQLSCVEKKNEWKPKEEEGGCLANPIIIKEFSDVMKIITVFEFFFFFF